MLDAKEHIHVIWYCINHGVNRIEPVEESWLKEIEIKDVPVILVLTQTKAKKRSDFIINLSGMNLPVSQIVPVLAEPEQIDDDYILKAHGLERLVDVTFEMLPKVAQKAFVKEQIASIELKAKEAFKYVSGYVAGAVAVGASPIPFSDAPLLVTMQTAMLANITVIFGLPFDRAFITALLSAIVGAGGMSMAGRALVGNLLKMIPGAGTVVGGAISASTAAALTLALGLAYIESLKIYMKAQINGETISLSDLTNIFIDLYKGYVRQNQKPPRDEPLVPPQHIDIQ